jgi:RNA polymerase sigma-70 factor (ECF subfamily)
MMDSFHSPQVASDFASLWDRYRLDITRFIHDRIRYDTREQREDMVQEVYARAWSAMRRGYGATQHERAWLFTIAHNLIVDYYRERSKRRQPEVLDAFVGSAESLLGTMPAADAVVEQTMAVERIQYLAALLTPTQAHVILRRMDGYAFSEIASEMGRDEGALKSLRFRATQQMRAYLGEL